MTIRPAVDSDVDQIRALIEAIPDLWHPDWRSDVLERAIRSADGLACVWIEGNELVGFACAHDVGFLAYLSLLAVAESARGHGVGTALIRHIEQTLADRGCTVLISDVWRDALGFYQALGWSAPPVILLRHRLLEQNGSQANMNSMASVSGEEIANDLRSLFTSPAEPTIASPDQVCDLS